MFGFFEAHQPTVWSTTDSDGSITPTGLTITGGGGGTNRFVSARSSQPLAPNQKLYFELAVNATAGNAAFGIMNSTTTTSGYPGIDTNGVGIFTTMAVLYNGAQIGSTGLIVRTGDLVSVAVDGTTQMVWIAINGGVWNAATVTSKGVVLGSYSSASFSEVPVIATQTGNPIVASNGLAAPQAFGKSLYLVYCSSSAVTETMTLNVGSSPFVYTPPTGFRAPNSCNTNNPR
jgi:hypothetical protein